MSDWFPEVAVLRQTTDEAGPTVQLVHGPSGAGKTSILREFLRDLPPERPRIHWEIPPLDESGLLRDLDRMITHSVGVLPQRERPDLLPVMGTGAPWVRRMEGLLMALGPGGGVLVLDGVQWLADARKRVVDELASLWRSPWNQGRNVHLILVSRRPLPEEPWGEGEVRSGVVRVEIGGRPYRRVLCSGDVPAEEARGVDPDAALARWTVFGDRWGHLPRRGQVWTDLRTEIIERILTPDGDLHDRPIDSLTRVVQAPQRYLAILEALASGPREWGEITHFLGQTSGADGQMGGPRGQGNRLAPYLLRLEEEGFLRIQRPLGASMGGRRRRYVLEDPFHSFWFSHVLPIRSLLHGVGAEAAYDQWIAPRLRAHVAQWLPGLAQRWISEHALLELGAPAREVGALWGDDVALDVAGRLANGAVLYGLCDRGDGTPQLRLAEELLARMGSVRYGIGRETRIPVLFLLGPAEPELLRWTARVPLGRIMTPARLLFGLDRGTVR